MFLGNIGETKLVDMETKVGILNKVVMIDDNDFTNELHSRVANSVNLANEVSCFNNAKDALAELEKITEKYDFPELILADIHMPGMDGHEFSEKIQNMSGFNPNRTVLAFLTSSKDIVDVIKADENEVELYYWKPLNKDLLRKVLKTFCILDRFLIH